MSTKGGGCLGFGIWLAVLGLCALFRLRSAFSRAAPGSSGALSGSMDESRLLLAPALLCFWLREESEGRTAVERGKCAAATGGGACDAPLELWGSHSGALR